MTITATEIASQSFQPPDTSKPKPSALQVTAATMALKQLRERLERIGIGAECSDLLDRLNTRIEAARA